MTVTFFQKKDVHLKGAHLNLKHHNNSLYRCCSCTNIRDSESVCSGRYTKAQSYCKGSSQRYAVSNRDASYGIHNLISDNRGCNTASSAALGNNDFSSIY